MYVAIKNLNWQRKGNDCRAQITKTDWYRIIAGCGEWVALRHAEGGILYIDRVYRADGRPDWNDPALDELKDVCEMHHKSWMRQIIANLDFRRVT